MDWLYLDNNATTRPAPRAAAAAAEMEETLWANPSSVHRFGQAARHRVELARASVAALIGCRDRELVFTSGGTESNNLALRGMLGPMPGENFGFRISDFGFGREEAGDISRSVSGGEERARRVLLTTRIEHSAIREPGEFLERTGIDRVFIPVNRDGLVSPPALAALLDEHGGPEILVLVSVQWANNETGVIQPIAELAEVIQAHRRGQSAARVVFHTDATQAVGKIPVDVRQAGVDLLTLSGHKLHGPKGAGALFIKTSVRPQPQNLGGPQERDRRGGTENTPGIVGLGVAAELAREFLADEAAIQVLGRLRDRFEQAIVAGAPGAVVHSVGGPWSGGVAPLRLWNTSNIGFPYLEAEAVLLGLSERGLCASAGAACSSGSLEPSPVLLAMGIPPEIAHGSVRFSLSRLTTDQEIDRAVEIVLKVVGRLGKTLPVGATGVPGVAGEGERKAFTGG